MGRLWYQEYVSVSINICPWQDPMQLGIKVPGIPCGTPEFWQGKVARYKAIELQHGKLNHCPHNYSPIKIDIFFSNNSFIIVWTGINPNLH